MDKKQLVKLISYFTMGDGGVYPSGKNCMFVMNMRKMNLDYVEWCKSVMEEVTSATIVDVRDCNTDGCTRQPLVRLSTKTHPMFSDMRERIYTEKYKGICPHALKLLDFEALSILYMSDGSLYIDKPNTKKGLVNNSYSVSLHMKRLSYGDLFILKKALKEKLDLEWNINRAGKYYMLRLRCKDVMKFMDGVRPHILPSFSYKLISPNEKPHNMGDDIVCSL